MISGMNFNIFDQIQATNENRLPELINNSAIRKIPTAQKQIVHIPRRNTETDKQWQPLQSPITRSELTVHCRILVQSVHEERCRHLRFVKVSRLILMPKCQRVFQSFDCALKKQFGVAFVLFAVRFRAQKPQQKSVHVCSLEPTQITIRPDDVIVEQFR